MRDKLASDKINTKIQRHSIGKVFTSIEGRYVLISIHTVLLTVVNSVHHRVGRVLSIFSSRRNWTPPTLTRRRVCPPPPGSRGKGTLAGERGWESPNFNEGTYTVVLFIYVLFESNECTKIVQYTYSLKRRIFNPKGHLL